MLVNSAEKKCLNAIVSADGTRIILQALSAEFADSDSTEELLIDIHKVSIHNKSNYILLILLVTM